MFNKPLLLKTYRCGTKRDKDDGLRIGTVRFLPRGVPKTAYAVRNFFDVWLPALAPSRELLAWLKERQRAGQSLEAVWPAFTARYEREMRHNTDSRQAMQLLAEVARRTPIAIGCYCEDESHCHRRLLRQLILELAGGG